MESPNACLPSIPLRNNGLVDDNLLRRPSGGAVVTFKINHMKSTDEMLADIEAILNEDDDETLPDEDEPVRGAPTAFGDPIDRSNALTHDELRTAMMFVLNQVRDVVRDISESLPHLPQSEEAQRQCNQAYRIWNENYLDWLWTLYEINRMRGIPPLRGDEDAEERERLFGPDCDSTE